MEKLSKCIESIKERIHTAHLKPEIGITPRIDDTHQQIASRLKASLTI